MLLIPVRHARHVLSLLYTRFVYFFLVVLLLSFHMQLGSIYNCLSVTEIAVYTLLRILNV